MGKELFKYDFELAVRKRGGHVIIPPEYTDGCLELYRVKTDNTNDFPEKYLVNENMEIWFREISVFDRMRSEFEQNGKEVTMKVRIPRFKGIDSECVCVIEGIQHQVQNAAHVINKNGFMETELTLIKPERKLRIS